MADRTAVDISKLKLTELRQECASRELDTKGNKQDLIQRLQAYLEEHAEEEVNEEDVLAEDTERLKKRAERFNVPGTAESKKAARAARFGLPVVAKGTPGTLKTMISAEKLRERAERFGMNVSSLSKKCASYSRNTGCDFGPLSTSNPYFIAAFLTEDDEKMKKRKERFGIVTSSAGGGDDVEAKKRKRAERFGIV
ncbi:SAP domain-containing ribonucleoprotein [Scyliorhinus canicula]|uniref:SAP domain-containing ribonucleoprotein n=1 Tax=Scyliorhinus canicula TaxID=7830 RepID=UPI0018F57B4C|nr:SAP domain-containing ribonucleoprotein [Scyliorhinus canicula]